MRFPENILAFETLTGKPELRLGFDKGRSSLLSPVKLKEGRHDGQRFALTNVSEIKSKTSGTTLFASKKELGKIANPCANCFLDDG